MSGFYCIDSLMRGEPHHGHGGFTEPQIRVFERGGATGGDQVQSLVNEFLTSGRRILAVSPVAVAMSGEDGYPLYAVTVVYQEKVDPNGAPDDEDAGS